MKTLLALGKSIFEFFGLFIARQRTGIVNGYSLTRDLRVMLPIERPVCFDVGANKGQTIRLLQAAFARPIIHAFEPAAATFSALKKQSFGEAVYLHRLALGKRAERAEFRNYAQSELSSLLALNPNPTENLFAREALISTESVQIESVDAFCFRQGIDRIDLLKIDTQGYELPVLQGSTRLLEERRIRAILLELNFAPLYQDQSDALTIFALLRSYQMNLVGYYENERIGGTALSWTTALFVQQPTMQAS